MSRRPADSAVKPVREIIVMGSQGRRAMSSSSPPKGTYNDRLYPVSETSFLRKSPRLGLQTLVPSPREAMARARAPRRNQRAQQRCRPSSPRLAPALGSRTALAILLVARQEFIRQTVLAAGGVEMLHR